MYKSESIINNLLIEVDSLTYRLRNIKQSYKTTINISLRKRLIIENKSIFKRIDEINKLAKFLHNIRKEKLSFSSLLIEKTKRTLKESKREINLFFL